MTSQFLRKAQARVTPPGLRGVLMDTCSAVFDGCLYVAGVLHEPGIDTVHQFLWRMSAANFDITELWSTRDPTDEIQRMVAWNGRLVMAVAANAMAPREPQAIVIRIFDPSNGRLSSELPQRYTDVRSLIVWHDLLAINISNPTRVEFIGSDFALAHTLDIGGTVEAMAVCGDTLVAAVVSPSGPQMRAWSRDFTALFEVSIGWTVDAFVAWRGCIVTINPNCCFSIYDDHGQLLKHFPQPDWLQDLHGTHQSSHLHVIGDRLAWIHHILTSTPEPMPGEHKTIVSFWSADDKTPGAELQN
eukprot:TRINITY_DN19111_c0_g1_i1.p1 TRINITY_DN19111_c0_g1~~TRINITY_DN19111_c0_g1_i1.p1  ORF type:complete len:301 (+),score=22.76 TRINITY_DN19111_c0_g1_i1:197-1099(+)